MYFPISNFKEYKSIRTQFGICIWVYTIVTCIRFYTIVICIWVYGIVACIWVYTIVTCIWCYTIVTCIRVYTIVTCIWVYTIVICIWCYILVTQLEMALGCRCARKVNGSTRYPSNRALVIDFAICNRNWNDPITRLLCLLCTNLRYLQLSHPMSVHCQQLSQRLPQFVFDPVTRDTR